MTFINRGHQPVAVKRTPTPGRMTLANVTRGRQAKPFRVLVYGVEGVGKTTFAAGAPDPVFLCAEDGTAHIDISRFPAPQTWADALEAIRALTQDDHEFKTLAIDTLDWFEPLCWTHVCAMGGKGNIEDFGYGKGYAMALDHWRQLLARLDGLVRARSMNVVLVAHAAIKRVDDPYTGPFDRYRMKLHERASDLMREWVDAVLFARYEVFTVEKKGKMRGVSSGARVLHTRWTAAYDAKNRFDLPETLPLDWQEFEAAARAGEPRASDLLRKELAELIPQLPDGERAKAEKARDEWAGDNSSRLAQLVDKVKAKIGLGEPTETAEPAREPGEDLAMTDEELLDVYHGAKADPDEAGNHPTVSQLRAVAKAAGEAAATACADLAADIYAAGGRELAIAEARAAYWKAVAAIGLGQHDVDKHRIDRDDAALKLRALGASP